MDDSEDSFSIECSYCGASVYHDAVRCGKCGNYTDDLGPRGMAKRPGEDEKRPLAKGWVIAGWITLIAFVLTIFACGLMGLLS